MEAEDRPLNTPTPPSGEEMDEDYILGIGMPAPDAAPGIEVDQGVPSPNPGPEDQSGAFTIKVEPADVGATATPTNIEELDAAVALKELNRAIAHASDGTPALVASITTDVVTPSVDSWAPSPTVRQTLKSAESLILRLRRVVEQLQAEAGLLRAEADRNAERLAGADEARTEMDRMAHEITTARTELQEMRVQAIICRDQHKPEGGLILEKVQEERASTKIEARHIRRRVQYLEKEVHRLTGALAIKERAYDATRGQYKSILQVNEKLRQKLAEASKKPAGKLSRKQRALRAKEAREQEAQARLADVPMDERALVIVEEWVEPDTSAEPGTSAEAAPAATSAPAPEVPNPTLVTGYTARSRARAAAYRERRAARAAARATISPNAVVVPYCPVTTGARVDATPPIAVVSPYCPTISGKRADKACRALLPKKAMWRVETGKYKLHSRAPQLLTSGNSVPLGSAATKDPSGSHCMQKGQQQPPRTTQRGKPQPPQNQHRGKHQPPRPVSQPRRHSRDTSKHPRRSRESPQPRGTYAARQHSQHRRCSRSRSPRARHSSGHHHAGNRRR